MKTRKGFTIMELLVVIAILAALVGVTTPFFVGHVKEAKLTKVKASVEAFKKAGQLAGEHVGYPYYNILYYVDKNKTQGIPGGWKENWRGPYIDQKWSEFKAENPAYSIREEHRGGWSGIRYWDYKKNKTVHVKMLPLP